MKKITLPLLLLGLTIFPSSKLFSQTNEKIIKDYISVNKIKEYKKADLTNYIVEVTDFSESMKGEVVKLQQTYNGLPVVGGVATMLIKNNKVVTFADNFEKSYVNADSNSATLTKENAFDFVAKNTNTENANRYKLIAFNAPDATDSEFAKYRLVYTKHNDNLVLCYEFSFPEKKTPNYWNILVNANTGEIILKNNLNISCNFLDNAYSHDHSNHTHVFPQLENFYQNNKIGANNSVLLSPDNASYNVFAFPVEAPSFGTRSLVTNPWILASSPEGWHSDGTTHYTISKGNNVSAYQDLNDYDFESSVNVDGGTARNFDYPFTNNSLAFNNQNAAITNLFYANNMVHDIFYKFGFRETSRNFQKNNFNLGGVGNDHVMAEAQDGAGTAVSAGVSNYNNANFATPSDGGSGRMQMYLWVNGSQRLFYNAPSTATSRIPASALAQFGMPITGVPVTGDIKLSPVLDACTALPSNSLSGFIGLAERGGTCTFTDKVENMQNAGAIGAIIYNDAGSTSVTTMTGSNSNIYIHSQLINNTEGNYIKNQLASNIPVNVSMSYNVKRDGSFDNGVMIHEYGHGISNRLTGNGYSCLQSSQSKEQMGEGWSDFFAMMLTNRPGDNASVARGMATYVSYQTTTGSGIRPAKYSPDLAVNGFKYGDTNGMEYSSNGTMVPDTHSIGFVWASMLWDLHWKYVEKYGYASDVTSNATNGSSRVLQLVTDAIKLQPCNPTFIDGRNAILAAELATTGGQDKCMIWNAFARRGLGVNASAGSKTNINDQVQDLTVPAECVLSTNEVSNTNSNSVSIYPNPAKNEFYINFPSNTLGKVNVEVYDMSGKLVKSESKVSPDSKKAFATDNLQNGVYIVKVNGLGIDTSSKLIIKK